MYRICDSYLLSLRSDGQIWNRSPTVYNQQNWSAVVRTAYEMRRTCRLLQELLLPCDGGLEVRVDAGRDDGRRQVPQVVQHRLRQVFHILLTHVSLYTHTQTVKL